MLAHTPICLLTKARVVLLILLAGRPKWEPRMKRDERQSVFLEP